MGNLPLDPSVITASLLGIPIIFVVIGVVTFMRKLGVAGNGLLIASMIWGTGFGLMYQVSVNDIPAKVGGWFGYVVYGLAIGLLASLFYETLAGMLDRAIAKMIDGVASKVIGNVKHPGVD